MPATTAGWAGRRVLFTGGRTFLGEAVGRELLTRGAELVTLAPHAAEPSLFGGWQGKSVHVVHGRPDNLFRLHSAMAVHEVAAVFHFPPRAEGDADRTTSALAQAARMYSSRMPVVVAGTNPGAAVDGLSVAAFEAVFGPGDQDHSYPLPRSAAQLLLGGAFVPPADGPAKDWVFVRDAARACLLAAEAVARGGPGAFAFASGWRLSERGLALALRDVFLGNSPPPAPPPANPLGWAPGESLAEALTETLDWHRDSTPPRLRVAA
ncbi:MAG: hypothetical protein K2V38_00060 [Gemmataceae bacterium]|nr:hypothetical protein [Gemmataceae bacterium]